MKWGAPMWRLRWWRQQPELHVRPRLYEQNPDGMRAPLQEIFKAVGVKFIQGMVERIDVASREVEVVGTGADTSRRTLGYDRLVLATGSRLFRPPIPGLDQHAFNVDQVADAARARDAYRQPGQSSRQRRTQHAWWWPVAASQASRQLRKCRPVCEKRSARQRP